ncbi:hypothetical protein J6590_005864 [Homalodisca vitripennis]|nr:hypothetical protein J6590_005864 [Homalodisca vitripennis]
MARSDEDDPSGSKYPRMEEDSLQDKERFARAVNNNEERSRIVCLAKRSRRLARRVVAISI